MTNPEQTNITLKVEESPHEVARGAAAMFARLAKEITANGEPFRVALSGGSTPRQLYRVLTSNEFRDKVPWDRIHFFFGDERWVPRTSDESNCKLAQDELFDKLNINPEQVFPIPTVRLEPDQAAAAYAETIRREFGLDEGHMPRFDLIFLGLGDDGHTASCFPYTSVVNERDKIVDAPWVEKLDTYRITLTPPVLMLAHHVIFMVTGKNKAHTLCEVLEGDYRPEMYPSQFLRDSKGEVMWLVDKAAASELGMHGG